MKALFIKLFPIFFLAGIFLILFYKVFFLGQVFYDGDNFHLNIPEKYFFVSEILHGHVPLWNPYLFLGTPYFADFNLGTLNPLNAIYFLFPVPRALTVLAIMDLFGVAVGTYLLLRNFLLSKLPALFGAVVMSLGGMPFILIGNMTFLQPIAYIPFLFLATRKLCKEKTYTWILLLIALQFLQFIAGHPQATYYTMFFLCCYLFFFLPFHFLKKIVIIGTYIFFPLLLSSVQLLPFLEYVRYANRPVGSIAYAGWGGLSITLLATFIFPTFFGSHLTGTWWGPQQILLGFIGIPTLILLYIGIRYAKFQEKLFVVLGILGTFLLAFGTRTPLFYLFYYLVPGWKLFRAPSGILIFYTFFAAILASFGLERLQKKTLQFRTLGKILFCLSGISTVFLTLLYFYANKAYFWQSVLIKTSYSIHVVNKLLIYDHTKLQSMFQGILSNGVYVSIFLFCTAGIFVFAKKQQSLLLLLLTAIGFLVVNWQTLLLAPLSYYDAGKNIPHVLQPVQSGQYRLLSVPVDLHQKRQHLAPANFFNEEGQANLSMYQYDNNIERRLYQVGGYVSLVPASFSNFINAKDASTNVTNIDFSHASQEQLNLASVRYILSHEPIQEFSGLRLPLIAKRTGEFYIYENAKAFQRAYVLEQPYGGHIVWNNSGTQKISLTVSSMHAGHLIMTNWYYPGWRAFVNGKEVLIHVYRGTFQEIVIGKGTSQVIFAYDPPSVKIGAAISIIAALTWVILFLRIRKQML